MVEYGNYPVFLLRGDLSYKEVTSMQILPATPSQNSTALVPASFNSTKSHGVSLMTVEEVAEWVDEVVGLPQYRHYFYDGRIDGNMLLQLQEQDILQSLHVTHIPHVRKILLEIDHLRHSNVRDTFQRNSNMLRVLSCHFTPFCVCPTTTFFCLTTRNLGHWKHSSVRSVTTVPRDPDEGPGRAHRAA
jgi:hypothetical protein